MTALITPTSELEAVNECLENIGQSPVSTLSGDLGVDTQIALNFVRKVNRELQSRGWHWNTEENYKLNPTSDGDLLIPSNTLSVDTTGESKFKDLVARGRRLYDRQTHSYTFDSPVYVTLVVGLPFDEIPETARRYIALRAARIFEDRIDGQSDADTQDELRALISLEADELRSSDLNALTGSQTTVNILRR